MVALMTSDEYMKPKYPEAGLPERGFCIKAKDKLAPINQSRTMVAIKIHHYYMRDTIISCF
jgi:hypothetical protein